MFSASCNLTGSAPFPFFPRLLGNQQLGLTGKCLSSLLSVSWRCVALWVEAGVASPQGAVDGSQVFGLLALGHGVGCLGILQEEEGEERERSR